MLKDLVKQAQLDQPVFINFFGGPGCGKSVQMAKAFVELKCAGLTCEMVEEVAKGFVWRNELDALENQYQIAKLQKEALMLRAVAKTNFVVTDGPSANSLYYNRTYPHICDIEKTEKAILKWMAEFKYNVNFYLSRGNFEYEQEGRYQSKSQAISMDRPIFDALSTHIPLIVLPPNPSWELICQYITDQVAAAAMDNAIVQ